ncbi:hypothetical protein OROMI_024675 [Orobanche minor]
MEIKRLVYTYAGNGILALAADGKHLLWRWAKSDFTLNGVLMVNECSDCVTGISTPCLSLSKNDSYVISASGWMISVYNVLASKKMRNVMPPPPAAMCLMFYPPDNNIEVIGMDDSTILIYYICVDEIVVRDYTTWEKKKSTVLQISVEWFDLDFNETHVELDKDEDHFLAVHETQLAIYETATLRRVKHEAIRIRPCVKVVVVAAPPHKPKQFAMGLSSGGVVVIEPHQVYQGEWGPSRSYATDL